MTTRRVPARVLATALATAVLAAVGAAWPAPASATSYRYWSYWHGTADGGWSFAQVGASYRPAAGTVDGWRFAVSGAAGSVKPRAPASFTTACGSHAAAPSGQKLVGLVVDYGTTADAPPGQHPPRGVDTYCAQVDDNATSAQVLVAYASVRSESGLVCAVDGYPVGECGVIVQPTPPPTPRPTPKPTTGSTSGAHTSGTPTHVSAGTAAGSGAEAATTSPGAASPTGTATLSPSPTGSSSGPVPVAVGGGGVSPPSSSAGTPVGALAGAGLVLALGAAAVLRARRGRTPPPGEPT
jgi:hypothetical protein